MNLDALPRIDAASLESLMPIAKAIDVVEQLLGSGFDPEIDPARQVLRVAAGDVLIMPAHTAQWIGVKVATVAPGNPARDLPRVQALYVLIDALTLSPIAIFDGSALTTLRTPAVSAVAVRHLAPPDAAHLVLFGTGPQAWGHLVAICTVRPIERVTLVPRSRDRARPLAERWRSSLGLHIEIGSPDAVAGADVVACCTTARTPLFAGELLPDSAVVVAIGSHEPDAREVDDKTVRRCSVVVEARAAALREAGDVIGAIRSGALDADHLIGLADVVSGTADLAPGPRLFKSVGMSWQDLAVAAAAYEASVRQSSHRRVGDG
ncbi:MAG TPA: ornithine cyclodeaminase family protein [Jiangellaceae bacterium]|nr:ornithine cyclodeaminase family protein [Jiangellaceae bacterium]